MRKSESKLELWSVSTTLRSPERILSFLKTAVEINGNIWDAETQRKYQILLIKNRYYKPNEDNLSKSLFALIDDRNHVLTYQEAEQI